MFSVPTVNCDALEFREIVNKYPRLVRLIDKPPALGIYIFWDNGRWYVARRSRDGTTRHRGAFYELHTAVFYASK
jgi:hypothetical protein